MQSQHLIKIIRGKGSYGCDKNISSISSIFKSSNQLNKITQLRILHCPKLSSAEGIEVCERLITLNISCNSINSLASLKSLSSLQILDVKANCLKNLNGLQNIINLIRLDASQNLIQSCEGLGETHKRLQTLILFGNRLDDLSELKRLKYLGNLKDISFLKGGCQRSNPFCQDKAQYYKTLQSVLSNSKNTLVKIDDLSQAQVKQFFMCNFNQSSNIEQSKPHLSHNSINYNSGELVEVQKQRSQFKKESRMVSRDSADQKMLLMSQRQADLQHIISLKQDSLEELKYKYSQLQIANANQFRESIKKEAEYERVTGQIAEMARNLDRKDQKMSDLHRRIEELLKVNAAANGLADSRASELEKIRREFSQLRTQNSELKVLNKDQEARLRELQSRTLSNIEDKSQRIEQLRSKNEQTLRQNYDLQKEHEQYKDRIRELTQLLKQWQMKYQQTLKQLQNYHKSDRQQLIHEYESKIGQLRHKSDEVQRNSSQQCEQKLRVIERQYSLTLQNAIQKYSKLRKLFDEKAESEGQLKAVLKASMNKNRQYQNTLKQYQQTLIKSKKAIISLTAQNEAIRKEYYDSRGKLQAQLRQFQNELSKAIFGKDKAEKQLKQLRMSNDYLEKSLQNLNLRQKQFEELLQKNESLQSALDAKNVMLDDKNDRIQSLKAQLESMQKDQQQKVDIAQMQKLSQKYKRQKQLLKSLEAKCANLSQQNQALAQRCQTHNLLEQQVGQVREIIAKQSAELQQKQQALAKYYQSIEKLKVFSENLLAENGIVKGENNRLLSSLNEKQMRFKQAIKERESQWQRKISNSQQQMKRYKSIAEKFINFSKTVNI